MPIVSLRLRGGPCDGETGNLDVDDVDNPPMVHSVRVHGAHERTVWCEYRRVGREEDGGAWIYQSAG